MILLLHNIYTYYIYTNRVIVTQLKGIYLLYNCFYYVHIVVGYGCLYNILYFNLIFRDQYSEEKFKVFRKFGYTKIS